jgi:hypothetical protein
MGPACCMAHGCAWALAAQPLATPAMAYATRILVDQRTAWLLCLDHAWIWRSCVADHTSHISTSHTLLSCTADFLQATSAASPLSNKKLAGCGSPRRAHLVTMPAT